MTPQEKLKEIEKLYENLFPPFKDIPHNAHVLFLIARVKKLEAALLTLSVHAPRISEDVTEVKRYVRDMVLDALEGE